MADVTVSPIDAGQVAVSIELENAEELIFERWRRRL